MDNPELTVGWLSLLRQRPQQLWGATENFFWASGKGQWIFMIPIFLIIILGAWSIWKERAKRIEPLFSWQLLSIFALIPYPFYMIWRGNYGNFFTYYITPHFVFLVPLFVLGLVQLWQWQTKSKRYRLPISGKEIVLILLGTLIFRSVMHIYFSIYRPVNNAGLQIMDHSILELYRWSDYDKQYFSQNKPSLASTDTVFRIFTPNRETEHYDYLSKWRAQTLHRNIPRTVLRADDWIWYILIEPDRQIPEKRFVPWYKEVTSGAIRWRAEQIGDLTLETWIRPEATVSAQLKP
jgi:hypothetical protein